MSKKKKNRPAKDFEAVVPDEAPVSTESLEEDVVISVGAEDAADADSMDIADLLQRYLPDFAAEDAVPSETVPDISDDPEYVEESFEEEPAEYTDEADPATDPDEYTGYELSEDGDFYEEPSEEYEDEE